MSKISSVRGMAVAAGLMLASPAGAVPVIPAAAFTACALSVCQLNQPLAAALSQTSFDQLVHVDSSAGGGLTPTAKVVVSAGAGKTTGGGTAAVTYAFTVAGPPGIVPVLLHVTGSATVFTPTQQGIFGDGAVAKVLSDIGNASTAASSGFPSFDVTFHGNVGVGQIVHVEVDAFFLSGGDGFSGTAQADPLPAIDPAFPNASLYSIVLSDGLLTRSGQPGTGIDEPGGLPLFILTLAGLILTARGYRYSGRRNQAHLS